MSQYDTYHGNEITGSKKATQSPYEETELEDDSLEWIPADFSEDQEKKLHEKIKKCNITIIKENCEAGDMSGYAALSPEGRYVVVKYSSGGRTQHVTA